MCFHTLSNANQYLAKYSKVTLYRCLVFSLHVALASLVLCPMNFRYFGLSGLSSHLISSSPGIHQASLEFFLPAWWLGISLKVVSVVKNKVLLHCFPFLRDYHYSSHNIQCLEKPLYHVFYYYFCLFQEGE